MAKNQGPKKRAAILYWTRFGNTEEVAKAIEQGLRQSGMDTQLLKTEEAAPEALKGYDLICVGGPTENSGANPPIREFLGLAGKAHLEGRLAFAFDTKYGSRFSGSAAKYIENSLDDQGLRIVAKRASAIVTSTKEGGRPVDARLRRGEVERFANLGTRIGAKTEEFLAIDA